MSFTSTHCYGEFNSSTHYGLNSLLEDLKSVTGETVYLDEVNLNHQMMTGTEYPACVL
ncbi:hypothetical protein [Synechococcus phage MA10]|uniref:Uncharacterized protein n=1 Tax=Synechococcus phage S-H34 TaxID=2718942 RepID=A0A6G8R6S2_9CAUD|nr:hypothetical protein PQC15_gp205 [Synechococcus phage S-H34]QIN97076.1 hypothetical protein [Synechococcus phage S-H34]